MTTFMLCSYYYLFKLAVLTSQCLITVVSTFLSIPFKLAVLTTGKKYCFAIDFLSIPFKLAVLTSRYLQNQIFSNLSIPFKLAVLTSKPPTCVVKPVPVNTFPYLKDYRRKKIVRTNHRRFPFPIVYIPYVQWTFYRYARLTNPVVITSMN